MPRNGCGIAAQPENNDWLVVNQLSAELAFCDALETSDAAVKMMGDDTLRAIARELVPEVRRNVTIDWAVKESARAKLRVLVKRVLRRYGYPPEKQEQATYTVLTQAEVLSCAWAAEAIA
jgi:type I restriction enzyme, R subunit